MLIVFDPVWSVIGFENVLVATIALFTVIMALGSIDVGLIVTELWLAGTVAV